MRSGTDPEGVDSWRLSGKLHFLQLNDGFSREISGISLNGLIQNLFSHQEKHIFKKSRGETSHELLIQGARVQSLVREPDPTYIPDLKETDVHVLVSQSCLTLCDPMDCM